ncbi:ATP-binding protein [Bradyrhizobium sp. AZCC 2289]|uniref:ATP-binding protein n=1 Tax=Bradyrhizobium sp. AZCC 2289 TaxID=3117026 RepID=UPI002FF0E89B
MAKERPVEITPSAAALVESLRGLGYSPETAVADLIDNSIAAEAATIELELEWNDGHPQAALLDDGNGMDRATLVEALRFGGSGPTSTRTAGDLGRFGLGLKTASLSQCRRLTIVSRAAGGTSAMVLDVDEIAKRGWFATEPAMLPQHPLATKLLQLEHGTLVLWDRMDSLGGLSGLQKDAFYLRLQDIRAHLGMVFHRFLGEDTRRICILTNGRTVKPWDPFQKNHASIIEMRSERIRYGSSSFEVKPYILPHRDRFTNDAEYEAAGGPGGWNARQGFYVYRAKRLLVAGSWLGLGGARAWTRDESSRLARIQVDLPTELDADWRIDVRKSHARPPGALRARLTAIAEHCRAQAREVFVWRGLGPRARSQEANSDPLWLASAGPNGTNYRINRKHPALAAFADGLKAERKQFDALLTLIEQSVPVERIWLDISEAQGAPIRAMDDEQLDQLTGSLTELAKILPTTLPAAARVDLLLRHLPQPPARLRNHLLEILGAAA